MPETKAGSKSGSNKTVAIVGLVGVGGVLFYLWWKNRQSQSADTYGSDTSGGGLGAGSGGLAGMDGVAPVDGGVAPVGGGAVSSASTSMPSSFVTQTYPYSYVNTQGQDVIKVASDQRGIGGAYLPNGTYVPYVSFEAEELKMTVMGYSDIENNDLVRTNMNNTAVMNSIPYATENSKTGTVQPYTTGRDIYTPAYTSSGKPNFVISGGTMQNNNLDLARGIKQPGESVFTNRNPIIEKQKEFYSFGQTASGMISQADYEALGKKKPSLNLNTQVKTTQTRTQGLKVSANQVTNALHTAVLSKPSSTSRFTPAKGSSGISKKTFAPIHLGKGVTVKSTTQKVNK
jgi:hypothetical protein